MYIRQFLDIQIDIGEFNIGAPKACLQLKSKTTQSCFNIGLQRVCNPFVVKSEAASVSIEVANNRLC